MSEHPHPTAVEHETHTIATSTYVAIYLALLVLLGATVGVYYIDLGPLNTAAALFIAAIKATLVVLIFMHVRYSSRLTWLFAGAGLYWLGILLALTFSDYLTRGWRYPVPIH